MNKNEEANIANLYNELKALEKKNRLLKESNDELVRLVNSRNNNPVVKMTDSLRRVLRGNSKEQVLKHTEENKEKISKIDSDRKETTTERAVVAGKIDIININFYDWDGKVVYKGGAERYVYDLSCVLKAMGYQVRILQCSNQYFEKNYKGIKVIGIGGGDINDIRACSELYSYFCRDAELLIASPHELACGIKDIPTIGINHGINFDGYWNKYVPGSSNAYPEQLDALKNVISCVCVDTNFINFTRTQDYESSFKEVFIPNYYDEELYKDVSINKNNKKINFVFPRRLCQARGFDITLEAFEKVFAKNRDKAVLNIVGQIGEKKAGELLKKFIKKYPDNVFYSECEAEDMPKIYKNADVVLIPTKYCEGTSLSCIEGMASGAAVVVTDVGGLTNLVIDGFNGRVIKPTVEDLYSVVEEMIADNKKRLFIAKNGLAVAKSSFTKKQWAERWKNEICRVKDLLSKA